MKYYHIRLFFVFIFLHSCQLVFGQTYYYTNFKKGYYYLNVSPAQSVEYFDKAIQNDSSHAEAYFYRGLAYYKMDSFDHAISDFERAYSMDTTLTKIKVFISYAYRGLRKWPEALKSFNEYLDKTSSDSVSFNWLMQGKLRTINGDLDGALRDFRKAVLMNPKEEKYRFYLFLSEYQQEKYEDALIDINKILDINPRFYGYYFLKGNTHFKLGKFTDAISDYSSSLKMNPINADGYYRRGWARDTLNLNSEAINDYSKAIELKSNDGAYYARRGNILFRIAKKGEACKDWFTANELGYYADFDKVKKLCN